MQAEPPALPGLVRVPCCHDCHAQIVDKDGVPLLARDLARRKRWYPECGSALRPGVEPRRHTVVIPPPGRDPIPGRDPSCVQRRPGVEPRRHARGTPRTRHAGPPLNEGRGSNPGDTCGRGGPCRRGSAPLNEGRGSNPGDTVAGVRRARHEEDAQRRPGVEPRRHPLDAVGEPRLIPYRSTKAGGRTPATPQERGDAHGRHVLRSTKAGGRTPATRAESTQRRHTLSGPLNEGRGSNPGDTSRPTSVACPIRAPLNEGRGSNPGDTDPYVTTQQVPCCAQRRPGVEPRRH